MRWKQLFDFCDNVGIYPDKINLFLTTLNVEESYKSWKKSEEQIPFRYYNNNFFPFVYFGVNRFINRDNLITTMGGEYNKLHVSLSDGTCVLNNIEAVAEIKSQSGNIKVFSAGAAIRATSKYGEVSANLIPKGNSTFILETITGNIDLIKTE